MEILAVIEALGSLKEPCAANIYSDSRYVVDAIEKGWVERWRRKGWMRDKTSPALNVDLWQKMQELLAIHEARFIWVKGHADNKWNERCDQLAREYIKTGRLIPDEGYQ
jgi:ribonuclease HI